VSNPIRYDPILVRYLAAELSERLAGRHLLALRLDSDPRRAVFDFGDLALIWELHPRRGAVRLAAPADAAGGRRRARFDRDATPYRRRVRVVDVRAVPDERLLEVRVTGGRVVVELMTNQWNVLALDEEDRILAVLWRREAGGRRLAPGAAYSPPPAQRRAGLDSPLTPEEWRGLLEPVAPEDRPGRLIRDVAYMSPLNAAPVLGEAAIRADPAALEEAYERYRALVRFGPAEPCVLNLGGARQPYPVPPGGVCEARYPTLLDAIAAAAGPVEGETEPAAPAVPAELLERARARLARLDARIDRMRRELAEAAPEAAALRRSADLLLSQLYLVRKGMTEVQISDFEGGTLTVALDPSLPPSDNVQRIYERARKRERAAERIPDLIQRAEPERRVLEALVERARTDPAAAAELAAVIGEAPGERKGAGGGEAPALPYRRYRTSGGLEARVGRSSRANDELTFHHSSPNDIWLHARDVAGSHVILRWSDPEANPPRRDLVEAAVLAALHSRARTSGTVAVDWTRRKYVRKPRKAPPGLVVPERVRTLFVEPDPELERRLRVS